MYIFAAEMKRLATILTSLTLSLIIITLGAGVTFVHCCHTESTEVAQVADIVHESTGLSLQEEAHCKCDNNGPGACLDSKHHCKGVTVITLTSQFFAKQHPFSFLDFPQAVSPFTLITNTWPLYAGTKAVRLYTRNNYHSPPREYLRRLGVLII